MARLEISSGLLARNTLLNFIGQAVPLLVGVVTIPFIVRGLGTERFGLLSLAWVILGYFSFFDLGLGWATTKFVAEALGKGEEDQIPSLVWTAVTAQAILGAIGAIVLAGITPLLVERILKIPLELLTEAKATFYFLALSVPVVLVSGSFRGVLEATQRFDLVNAVKIPVSALTFLLPLIGLWLGFSLPGIVALILLARVGALVVFAVINFRISPRLRKYSAPFYFFSRLISFGGWITVSSVINPILTYFDRFLIGSLVSMDAAAYYAAPHEAITRLQIIPSSLTATLFPAFSTLEGTKDRQKIAALFARSVKYILLVLGPVVITVLIFAEEILQLWLGQEFAKESTAVMQILGLGILVNSLAYVPSTFLSGTGRADIPAKLRLLEFPIYIAIAWLLVKQWKIQGAAGAWTLRVTLDAFLLFRAAFKIYRIAPRLLALNGTVLAGFALAVFAGLAYGLKTFAGMLPFLIGISAFISLLGLFAWFSWRKILTPPERRAFWRMVTTWRK